MVASEAGSSASSGNLLESNPFVELMGGKLADMDVDGRGRSLAYAGARGSG